jgi:hypothetical protein
MQMYSTGTYVPVWTSTCTVCAGNIRLACTQAMLDAMTFHSTLMGQYGGSHSQLRAPWLDGRAVDSSVVERHFGCRPYFSTEPSAKLQTPNMPIGLRKPLIAVSYTVLHYRGTSPPHCNARVPASILHQILPRLHSTTANLAAAAFLHQPCAREAEGCHAGQEAKPEAAARP